MNPHLVVAGVPRTGTTLLANLLTVPEERRWCSVEPGHFAVTEHQRIYNRAKLLGWQISSPKIDDVLAFLSTLDRFGVKEVHQGQTQGAIKLAPLRIVACVRDARDIAVSMADPRFVHARRPPTPLGMAQLTNRYLQAFRGWKNRFPVTVVRYEDLVKSESYRVDLGVALDWPLAGDPSRNLDLYRRGDEKRDGVVSRRTPADRQQHAELAVAVHEACCPYQSEFGYA